MQGFNPWTGQPDTQNTQSHHMYGGFHYGTPQAYPYGYGLPYGASGLPTGPYGPGPFGIPNMGHASRMPYPGHPMMGPWNNYGGHPSSISTSDTGNRGKGSKVPSSANALSRHLQSGKTARALTESSLVVVLPLTWHRVEHNGDQRFRLLRATFDR